MPTLDIHIQPVSTLTLEENQVLTEIDQIAFHDDQENPDNLTWSHTDWQLTGQLAGRVVSMVGVVERTIQVGSRPMRVGGIGGVATLPEFRQRGYAGELLQASQDFMRATLGVDFGMLFCSETMVKYYQKFGYQVITNPLVFDQPGGKNSWSGPVMVLPLLQQVWPEGAVDLCGLPW